MFPCTHTHTHTRTHMFEWQNFLVAANFVGNTVAVPKFPSGRISSDSSAMIGGVMAFEAYARKTMYMCMFLMYNSKNMHFLS